MEREGWGRASSHRGNVARYNKLICRGAIECNTDAHLHVFYDIKNNTLENLYITKVNLSKTKHCK